VSGALIRRFGLEPGEGPLVIAMGSLAALLIGTYTIAKVLRDALFIGEYGALSLPYAYIAVALTSAAYVFLESRVARSLPRLGALRFSQTVAIGASLALAMLLPRARHLTAALFYLWTSSQAMMLLPHFWAMALDLWNSRRARRLFPLLGGCGLIGGLLGGALAAGSAKVLPQTGLIWMVPALLLVVRFLTAAIERRHVRRPAPAPVASGDSSWEIIRRSRYIKVLALALTLSVCISTLVDFQFKIFVQKMFPAPHDLTRFLGTFQVALNSVSLLLQFGATGWLLQRLGLGPSTGLQPGTVLVFASWAALTTGGWAVIAMRWLQGVVALTLGKSSNEIYYAAIRPNERRRIKPALDTLIERWSDAVVGVLLLVAMRMLHVPIGAIVGVTAGTAALWLFVLFHLDRQYGHAFREALSRRGFEPEAAPDSMRVPAARRAIVEALGSRDEARILLALRFCHHARDRTTAQAVRALMNAESPAVQAAALAAMEGMRLRDPGGGVERLIRAPHEEVRRAAVRHGLALGSDRIGFARRLLDSGDGALRREAVETLADHPVTAAAVLDRRRVEAWLASEAPDERRLAALALGALDAGWTAAPLRRLLEQGDLEERRLALEAFARRPRQALLEAVLPLLTVPGLGHEARLAAAAPGDAAVPALRRLLAGEAGDFAQARAARTLAAIATPRARGALLTLVRSGDPRLRHLGLSALARARIDLGRPVLPRNVALRLFLREMRFYRVCILPATALLPDPAPDLRLFGESWRESAGRAMERAVQALACWYDPRPLFGVLDRLRPSGSADAAPALEYLARILPRGVFRAVSRVVEQEAAAPPDGEGVAAVRLTEWIRSAWKEGDPWLRAVAVRASRHVPGFDRRLFDDDGEPMVRAEIDALGPAPAKAGLSRPRPAAAGVRC
jgi:AAA family ATP:ADP antiporter